MKRIIAIFLLCLFALLLIAARPRPCKTRSECFFQTVYTPTLTATRAATAIQAAQTGHLVLSTVHTNDAAGAIARFVDMGIEPFLIASTVNAHPTLSEAVMEAAHVALGHGISI